MRTVRQLLESKPAEIIAISPDAPVIDAIRLMAERRVGALVVMEGARLAGILSERDYARKIVLQGRSSRDTPVRDIMTAEVITVRPEDSSDHCMQVVTDKRIRHLPVMQGGDVVGVLSIGDLVRAVNGIVLTRDDRVVAVDLGEAELSSLELAARGVTHVLEVQRTHVTVRRVSDDTSLYSSDRTISVDQLRRALRAVTQDTTHTA